MSKLHETWKTYKLSDIIELIHGYQFRTNDFTETGIAVVKIGNVNGRTLDLNDLSYISENRFEEFKRYQLHEGDIVMSLTGNIGRVVEVGTISFPLLQNYRVGKFEAINSNIVFNKYIKFLMSSSVVLNRLDKLSNQSAQANFGKQDMDKIVISIPPLEEQKKIADILSTVDQKIDLIHTQINDTQVLKKGLMQKLLTEGIGHSEFKESEIGRIPVGWEVELLDSLSKRGSGHTPNKQILSYWNGGIKWVSLADSSKMDNRYIYNTDKEISQEGIKNSSAVLHPKGTVILVRDAGVGKSGILGLDMAVSQHYIAWVCGKSLDNIFLYYWLQRHKPVFESIAIGSTIKTIGLGYFKKLKMPSPPLKEQIQIAQILSTTDEKLESLQEKKEAYETLKKGLMQKLLTGEVRV